MNKITLRTLLLTFALLLSFLVRSQEESENETTINADELMLQYQKYKDSIDKTFKYQTGNVSLGSDLAMLKVPEGYKFIGAEQAKYVLEDLWGNPPGGDYGLLGMLVKEYESPIDVSYAVEISYSEEGYIEDDDAEDIDYDELLESMQEDAAISNPERIKREYPTIELVGWASAPFYDQQNKKLHWAQEYKFGGEEENTLNYNIRVLGRKGYINLNVIGGMVVLDDVKNNLDPILASVDFMEGNRYADFNPDFDDVAAYGIGGLIAGKVLAKAGVFALILKFWKFIALAIGGAFMAFKNRIFGKKEA